MLKFCGSAATVVVTRRVMFLLGPILVAAHAVAPQAPARDVAVVGVSVIDVVAGTTIPDQTIVVHGTRIVSLGPRGATTVPRGALLVDGTEKFLMPGLSDMHAHLFLNANHPGMDEHLWQFPLYVANGITGIRDMWTNLENLPTVRGWNEEAAAGRLVAPRITPTGPMIDGPTGIFQRTAAVVTSRADGRRVADSMKAGGAQALKIHGAVPRDAFFALAARSKEIGVPLIGHVPAAVTVREAITAGQIDIEHYTAADGCATAEAEAEAMRLRTDTAQRPAPGTIQRLLLDGYDERRCADLMSLLVQRGIWVTPTLAIAQSRLELSAPRITSRDELRYVPAADLAAWRAQRDKQLNRKTPEVNQRVMAAQLRLASTMQRAGVRLLVGTDNTNDWLVAGFSTHDELALFVRSGMTTAEALRAATLAPAKYLRATDSLGSVGIGKVADLVLLDADPLLDIGNARKIRAVFLRGRYLDRDALDALLVAAGNAANPR